MVIHRLSVLKRATCPFEFILTPQNKALLVDIESIEQASTISCRQLFEFLLNLVDALPILLCQDELLDKLLLRLPLLLLRLDGAFSI